MYINTYTGVTYGIYWDDGDQHVNYYLGFRVYGLGFGV